MERRESLLTEKDIELIREIVNARPCPNSCFTEEEHVMLRKWITVMDGTSSWLIRLIVQGLIVLVGIIAWLAVTHDMIGWGSPPK